MTDTSVLSASQAMKFLEWLDPLGSHCLVALDPNGAGTPEAFTFAGAQNSHAARWIEARNGKRNLYFSVNAPKDSARPDTKWRRDEIGTVRAFHVDIDALEGEPDWDPDCLPSAVVDSGGGRWAFWKLETPIPADDVAAIEAQNRALTARFHGDGQAHNLDRIARLPGTLNIPNAAKRKKGRTEAIAAVLAANKLTYSPQEVAAWCPPAAIAPAAGIDRAEQAPLAELDAPASVAKAARWLITDAPEAVEGEGGNSVTYQVVARLKDFGVSKETAFDLLLDGWNETKAIPPWPARDLLQIVRNAFAYGTAAPGKLAGNLAESEFEPVAIDSTDAVPPAASRRQMRFEPVAEVNRDFKAQSRYLIRGMYDRGSMVVTYGESNSGKTHVVLDQSIAVASGLPWAGKPVHQGLVVYVAAEGGTGIQDRIMAHRQARSELDWDAVPFALVRFPIDLMRSTADSRALVAQVKAAEAHFGASCVMVVIDTLSRALAGGDENSSADMGTFVKRCDEIRAATGAALHVIHHAGKNTAKGARGHSLLRAAVDTEIEIEAGAILTRKQRDMEPAPELRFSYKPVDLGKDAEGATVRSVVLEVWEATEFEVEFTPQMQNVFSVIESLVTQKTQNIDAALASPETSMFTAKEVLLEGIPHATVERALREMTETGVLAKCKRGLYKINRTPKPSRSPQAL